MGYSETGQSDHLDYERIKMTRPEIADMLR